MPKCTWSKMLHHISLALMWNDGNMMSACPLVGSYEQCELDHDRTTMHKMMVTMASEQYV